MLRFVLYRMGVVIPTFLGVTILAFSLIRLIPGDPIELMVGERGIEASRHAELRAQYGFDKPLLQQYAIYLGGVLDGDLGRSIVTKQPVLDEFMAVFPATVELALLPGLCFDEEGTRLGYGRGYFDRFLSRLPATVPRVGVSYDALVVPRLPREAHDRQVTHLATESGVRAVTTPPPAPPAAPSR